MKSEEALVRKYLNGLERELLTGEATEHTYRPHLKNLLESFDKTILAINEPKRVKCGAPDYIVVRKQTPLGYIEAKDVGIPLINEEKSEQMTRYRSSLSNLILTDYLDFRWYANGELRLTSRIGEVSLNRVKADGDGIKKFLEMVNSFLTVQVPTVSSPKELAQRMAALARLIRDTIPKALEDEDKGGSLREQMEGFREVLLHDLSEEQFADMYAQSICYGLFAARCNSNPSIRFTREHAAYDLPKTNPFLRKMFSHIAGPDLDDRVVWAVDDLAELLHHSDMGSILQDFGKRTRQEDPVVHFYETFLSAYDPKMREMRGVYYTPEPVVSYIVRSVDQILKRDFGLKEGLANASKITMQTSAEKKKEEFHKVQILDPACGTGTFLYGVVDQIHEFFRGNEGMWSGYVSEHLLPRLWGFELLMAPYAVAHMKLGLQLTETGYDFETEERLGIYLTNTVEEPSELGSLPLFALWLAEEANAAGKVKAEVPVMVVLGNPPYSGHSANKGKWIKDLLRGKNPESPADYFEVDGKPLGERNPKWLNDDYVKFIRFAQWRIEKTGTGILAFVTNHSYLDNPTFRGMRQALMKTFSEIYVLDLHGNTKKKERSPDGSEDDNVFDIQQGVAIGIFVKRSGIEGRAKVYHSEIWGPREVKEKDQLIGGKYRWLHDHDSSSTEWKQLAPKAPYYLFVPRDTALQEEYNGCWKITDLMPLYGVGMTTARDHMVIDFDIDPILERARTFRDSKRSNADLCKELGISEKKGWDIDSSRTLIRKETHLADHIRPVLYRPFDNRYIFYHDSLVWRTVKRVMSHMLAGRNLGLVTNRQIRIEQVQHTWVTKVMIDFHLTETAHANPYLFPLYLYPDSNTQYSRSTVIKHAQQAMTKSGDTPATNVRTEWDRIEQLIKRLFPEEHYPRFPNLHPDFIAAVETRLHISFIPDGTGDLQATLGPEDIFHYIYAVLHSPTYRERYSEFVKIDFPRVPLTSNPGLFRPLCSLGEELVRLHLMEQEGPKITSYPESGDSLVDQVRYSEPGQGDDEGRVWINKTQYFKGIPPGVWAFYVGGYRICQKWLKDRKGRKLSFDDLQQYQKIVSALSETIRIMGEIDAVIEQHGGFPLY